MIKRSISLQRKKKQKEKPAAPVPSEEAVVKGRTVQELEAPNPAARKRKKRPLKAGTENVRKLKVSQSSWFLLIQE